MNTRIKLTLIAIIFLAALLRFYQISINPPGLNSDEVAIGYNAYSILKTGKDEYGQSFPLAFRSFDDYKPPVYVYLTVPSVALFGENAFAVRFPSALLGTIAVVLTFFLAKKLFGRNSVSLVAALLLAISPWHLQFTRTAYETGSTAFFTTAGLFLFLKGFEKNRYFVLSGLFFALEMYLYQASKVFVPAFVFLLLLIHFRRFKTKIFACGLFLTTFTIAILPVVMFTATDAGSLRFKGTSVFQDPKSHDRQVEFQIKDWKRNDNRSVLLFHPGFSAYFQDVLVGYLSHFRPDFLFTSRDDPKVAYVSDVGLLYLWEFPFLLFGLHNLLLQKDKRLLLILFGWIVLAPLPASVTMGVPTSIRTTLFLPGLQLVTAIGIVKFIDSSQRAKWILAPIILYFFLFYQHMLFVHAPIFHSRQWYAAYKDIVSYTKNSPRKYQKVIVSPLLDEPHVFFLFYLQYDPAKYLSDDGGTIGGGFAENRNHFGRYIFQTIDWFKMKDLENTLIIGTPKEFPIEAKIIKNFYLPDDTLFAVAAESTKN